MSKKMSSFLTSITKDLQKAGFETGESEPPRYWFSTGNYVMNKILSGSFYRGIPQGRVTGFAGPSGAGKSFLIANAIKSAQMEDAMVFVLDSENALDDDFVRGVGANPNHEGYTHVHVNTIPEVKKIVSMIVNGYKEDCDESSPKLLICIDSLDMLMTETEEENFRKGVSKGDQGQRNKQLKAMLREFVQAIKHDNISIIVTSQVYKNQDILNGEGTWIVSDAVKYSLSQIFLLTKLKLRDKDAKARDVSGIKLKVEGYKTRFTKPFQTVTIEVPYDTGMDPYNGLLDVAVELGLIDKKGSRYVFPGEEKSWVRSDFDQYAEKVLALAEEMEDNFLEANISEEDLDLSGERTSAKSRRQNKATDEE